MDSQIQVSGNSFRTTGLTIWGGIEKVHDSTIAQAGAANAIFCTPTILYVGLLPNPTEPNNPQCLTGLSAFENVMSPAHCFCNNQTKQKILFKLLI